MIVRSHLSILSVQERLRLLWQDQISDDVVKDRFGRLLEEVQTISSKMCSRHEGTVQRVLVESCNEHDERLMTGRLSNNLLVHFPEMNL